MLPRMDLENVFVNNEHQLGRQASQMMADHGDPCSASQATYCMNGGACYQIPFMDALSCVCSSSYIGSRCEQFQLHSTSINGGHAGLITAVVIVTLLVLIVLAFVIYYACKTWKTKTESTRSGRQQYWRVKSRV